MAHIATTHVGSLPRPQNVSDLLVCREHGEAFDAAELAGAVRETVENIVRQQHEAGIDIPSDGETSKIGYATYIQERLTGFGGDQPRKPALDMRDYPELRRKMALISGEQSFRRSQCIGPVTVKDHTAVVADIDNLKSAMQKSGYTRGFLTAASPGVVTAFQPNAYYPSHEAYLAAVGEAMREEYEAIVNAGLTLQLDCPDLAMARHTGFQDLSTGEFLTRAEQHVDALNHALRNIPASAVRMHLCWGNYEGPHDHDIDLRLIMKTVMRAKPQTVLFEAANPRHEHEWAVWAEADIPDNKVLAPGVLDTTTNFVEHPELVAQRLERFADIVGAERVQAGTDCGFGTFAGVARVDPGIIYKKLKSLVDGAAIASKRLADKPKAAKG